MPKISKSKDHKKRLQNFKLNQKRKMNENRTQQPDAQQLPPYRHIPVWDKNAKVEILGYEWEVIYNTVAQMQLLTQATNAVMSRNIVNGVIGMDFEKLDPQTLEYVPMTEEEKAPLKQDFNNTIESLKKGGGQTVGKQEVETELPTTNGDDIAYKVDVPSNDDIVREAKASKKQAKVVSMAPEEA